MNRWLQYMSITVLMMLLVMVGTAQDDDSVYTFESGAQFVIPEGVTILEDSVDSSVPVLTWSEQSVMDVVDPDIIGQTPDATLNAPLDDILDFLLGAVGFEGERTDDATNRFTLEDGREVIAFDFTNASNASQSVFVVRLNDGRVGALNFRTLEPVTDATVDIILSVLTSLNVPGLSEAELVADLTQTTEYESGVTFSYPEEFTIAGEDDPPATIGIDQELVITMVDPNIVGMPAGEPMGDIMAFAIGDSELTVEDFSAFDIGGREALIGTVEGEELFTTMVLIRFDDDTVGIMDILTLTEPTPEQIEYIRSVAASFNSATSEAAITSADVDEAQIVFNTAMDLRDAGEYEGAIDLFTQAIDLSPNLGLAYYWRASTYGRIGEVENAVADYRQALELAPEETQIRTDIADVYALYGDVESAIAELETYIDEVGEENVSEAQLDALEAYRQIADGDFNSDFYFAQAVRLREYGLYDLALEANQTLLDNDPDDPDWHSQRGVILVDAEDIDGAVDALTTAIELDPSPLYFYNRGFAYSLDTENLPSIIDKVHDYQCMILLADDSVTQEQLDFAQQSIDRTIISSDDYEPITDPDDCEA